MTRGNELNYVAVARLAANGPSRLLTIAALAIAHDSGACMGREFAAVMVMDPTAGDGSCRARLAGKGHI